MLCPTETVFGFLDTSLIVLQLSNLQLHILLIYYDTAAFFRYL